MQEAHAAGIIHDDVRAPNILFVPLVTNAVGSEDPPGRFVLIDWGLACLANPAGAEGNEELKTIQDLINERDADKELDEDNLQ